MSEKITLEEILAVYNSIHPSRRRWYGNINKLRNSWPELYKILEKASGRSGGRPMVFDPNWHTVVSKAGIRGAANKAVEIVEVTPADEEAVKAQTIREATQIAEGALSQPLVAVTEGDPLFAPTTQVTVVDESQPTVVAVKKKPVKKAKK